MGWVTGTWARRQAPAQRVTAAPASAAGEPEERGCKSFITCTKLSTTYLQVLAHDHLSSAGKYNCKKRVKGVSWEVETVLPPEPPGQAPLLTGQLHPRTPAHPIRESTESWAFLPSKLIQVIGWGAGPVILESVDLAKTVLGIQLTPPMDKGERKSCGQVLKTMPTGRSSPPTGPR